MGALMLLVALTALPLALYVHSLREEERRRAAVERYIKRLVGTADERLIFRPIAREQP